MCISEKGSTDTEHDNLFHSEGARKEAHVRKQGKERPFLLSALGNLARAKNCFFLGVLSSANDCTLLVWE